MSHKLSILYIAYSCSPFNGSEDRVGWKICEEAAKLHNVYVLTKADSKDAIEAYCKEHDLNNIKFFYVDIPNIYKRVFNGFLYSARLNVWHRNAVVVAKQICRENPSIRIIHQVTPVEFRAIGNYASINGIKFVCGPVGGGEYCPEGLQHYVKGHGNIELCRKVINRFYRSLYKWNHRFCNCSSLMFANHETKEFVGMKDALVETELGVDAVRVISKVHSDNNGKCIFLVAGRAIYRKGHALLFDALESLHTEKDYEIRIVGGGTELEKLKERCEKNEIIKTHVKFLGKISFAEMQKEYGSADVLIMPSIRETTGSVMFEALYNGLLVIAINRFGSRIAITDDLGWTYDGNTRQEYIDSLANVMKNCIEHPDEVYRKKQNIALKIGKYTWTSKIMRWTNLYNFILQKTH